MGLWISLVLEDEGFMVGRVNLSACSRPCQEKVMELQAPPFYYKNGLKNSQGRKIRPGFYNIYINRRHF
jgi:hypothetical protein